MTNRHSEPPMLSEPIHGTVETLGRFLDPVRAHALAQAVAHVGVNGVEGEDLPGEVLAIAEQFAEWLAVGPNTGVGTDG